MSACGLVTVGLRLRANDCGLVTVGKRLWAREAYLKLDLALGEREGVHRPCGARMSLQGHFTLFVVLLSLKQST